jgi:putative DNA primase/helicase
MAIDVEAVKAATDLVSVVGNVTPLVKRGSEYVGKCVAHSPDNNPSMYVNVRKGLVHCFSCGFSTDLIGFVQHVYSLDFKGACEWLGAKPSLSPALSAPPRKTVPSRITSKPPADAESPNMLIRSLGPPSKIWPYRDSDGQILGYVARYDSEEGKEIRVWSWGKVGDAPAGWACGHWNAPRPLYGLDRLAARPNDRVVICEGEKAADAAGRFLPGYVAISWPGGAQSLTKADWSPLAGRTVLLWPDADEPGWKAMQTIASILADPAGLACTVRILDSNQMAPGWDAADAESEGWSTEELVEWAKPRARDFAPAALQAPVSAAEPTPSPDSAPAPSVAPSPSQSAVVRLAAVGGQRLSPDLDPGEDALPMALSESGLAMEFVRTYGDDFRYVCEWDKWLVWNGSRWVKESRRNTAMQRLTAMSHSLKYRPEARELTTASKNRLEAKNYLGNILDLAEFDRRLIISPAQLDTDPMLLGTPDGTVDLTTGVTRPPAREDCITRNTTVAPAPGPHPLWDQVIACMTGGDPEIEAYVWRWLGYILTGSVREEAFLFLHGAPASGKSTAIEAVADILGDALSGGYSVKTKLDLFLESKHERPGDMHIHFGARFAHASETEEGRHWKSALLKEATGGDTVLGERKYENLFAFKPSHKLVIHGNFRPHLRSADEGVRRRLHLIEYKGSIAEDKRDTGFKARLRAEYPQILHHMIAGCLAWQQTGLRKPAAIAANVSEYFDSEDLIGAFMEECIDLDTASVVRVSDLYDSYVAFIEKQGERPASKKRLSTMLQSKGFKPTKTAGARGLSGLRLRMEIPADRWARDDHY